jgi:hypothetical protein
MDTNMRTQRRRHVRNMGRWVGVIGWPILYGSFAILSFLPCAAVADSLTVYPAIVLNEDLTFTVASNGSAELRTHRRIKVNNTGGKDVGLVVIEESKFAKLEKLTGVVTDLAGRQLYKCREKDGEKLCGFGAYQLYADICDRLFLMPASQFPCIIDYDYVVSYKSVFFWPEWRPQISIPIGDARYTLIVPRDFKFKTTSTGTMPQPTVAESGKGTVFTWELKDIPAMKRAACIADFGAGFSSLRFSPTECQLESFAFHSNNWQTLGRSCYALVRSALELSDQQTALADQMRQNLTSPDSIVRAMHQVLSQKTRYVAVHIGIGGWQPHKSSVTFADGYGDCKDLSILYVSMLRRAGVNAVPALVMTRDVAATDPAFPENRFNHMIFFATTGIDTIWVDPTCSFCDPRHLPSQDENIFVLALDSSGGQLVRTPSTAPDDNKTVRTVDIRVNEDKSLSVEVDFAVSGNSRYSTISYLMEAEKGDRRLLFRTDMLGMAEAFRIDSFFCPASESIYPQPLVLRAYGTVQNGVLNVGKKWYVNVEFLSEFGRCELCGLSDRHQNVEFAYPAAFVDSIAIHVPAAWTIGQLPTDTSIVDNFGSYSRQFLVQENQVLLVQNKKSFAYAVTPDQFVEFQKHINQVNAVLARQVPLYVK